MQKIFVMIVFFLKKKNITGEKAIANFFRKHPNINQIQHSRIIYYTTDVKGYMTTKFLTTSILPFSVGGF